jgi:hypothetical protein
MHNQNEDETLLKVTTSQETIELNSINTGNIERQSLDSNNYMCLLVLLQVWLGHQIEIYELLLHC